METFDFFLHDDRFDTPATVTVVVSDIRRARERAGTLLSASVHHRGVEVRHGSRALFKLGDCERRPARPRERTLGVRALEYLRSARVQALHLWKQSPPVASPRDL